MRLAAGVTLGDGRYRLQSRLGAGGMASVWLGHDDRLGRSVAVKVVADTLADDERWLARFQREARAAAALSHPNIVQVFDYGVEDGRPYLVMEHVAGVNLSERLADPAQPRPDPEVLARELLEAVAHVHEAGIVHRDIKPANILLDATGRAHLTDFGIAHPEGAASLTQTGMVIGTVKYLAPEVAEGRPASPASDLYSAGRVIGEVAAPTPAPALAGLIAALTESDPERRIGSATAALDLLGAPSPAITSTAPTRAIGDPATAVQAATAATRFHAHSDVPHAHSDVSHVRSEAAPVGGRPRPRTVQLLVAGGLIVALILLVVALNSGGNQPPTDRPAGASAAPAQSSAPLSEQLRALDRLVDQAAGQ